LLVHTFRRERFEFTNGEAVKVVGFRVRHGRESRFNGNVKAVDIGKFGSQTVRWNEAVNRSKCGRKLSEKGQSYHDDGHSKMMTILMGAEGYDVSALPISDATWWGTYLLPCEPLVISMHPALAIF